MRPATAPLGRGSPRHVFYASFAAALGINVLAVIEGVHRYRFNHEANERRRIRMALYAGVPGVLAYAVKDGIPIVTRLAGGVPPTWPGPVESVLQPLILLPAFGLVYAVGVARVLGPRIVLRRSLQYALANRTLTVIAALPAAALIASLAGNPEARIRDLFTLVSMSLLAISIAGVRLPGSCPAMARRAVLPPGVRRTQDPGVPRQPRPLRNRSVRSRGDGRHSDRRGASPGDDRDPRQRHRGAAARAGDGAARQRRVTALDGGLVAMLRWSDEPLEIFIHDPRSPVRRLPAEEQEWLECTRAVLLVPLVGSGQDARGRHRPGRAQVGRSVYGGGSPAAREHRGADGARLRRRASQAAGRQRRRFGRRDHFTSRRASSR